MNSSEPLISGTDAGFRAFSGTDAKQSPTFVGTERNSFTATLDRIVGAPAKESAIKKSKQPTLTRRQEQSPESETSPPEKTLDRLRGPSNSTLISDCPVSPAAVPIPELPTQQPGPGTHRIPTATERVASAADGTDSTLSPRPSASDLIGLSKDCSVADSQSPSDPTSTPPPLAGSAEPVSQAAARNASGESSATQDVTGLAESNGSQETIANNTDFSAASRSSPTAPSDAGLVTSLIDVADPRTIVPNPDGTAGAKSEYEMKNTGRRNEIPRVGVKQMPSDNDFDGATRDPETSDDAQEGSAPSTRRDSAGMAFVTLDTSAGRRTEAASGNDQISSGPLRSTALNEMIFREVQVFRQGMADRVEVILKPDQHTEISIQFHWHNGAIEAMARCQQGDFSALSGQWSQLQQNLSHQGVRLMDLNSATAPGPNPSGNLLQNQNHGQPRRERWPAAEGAQEGPWSQSMTGPAKASPGHLSSSVKRLFESWA